MRRTYLQKDPDNMTMLPIYGLALHLQGSYPLSPEVFEKQRDLGDDSYAVHYYIGLNYYMLNNWPHAIPELEKAYQIDSSDVTLVYQLAHAKSHISHAGAKELNAESERLYSKALDMLKPSPAMMHNIYGSRAMSFHKAEDFRTAIEYYELSYRYNPKNISAISSIGYCYERLKDYRKAIEYYDTYLRLGKPGSAGYKFVTESLAHVEQELFMEQAE
jgi:tetratricopeptide (TPR) repeat protein